MYFFTVLYVLSQLLYAIPFLYCVSGVLISGQPYSDLYEPEEFGSAGGGEKGGRGGGRIWLNVTNTFHIDGTVSANGVMGENNYWTSSGGGSGGSIWIHTDRITGYGRITATGGKGSKVYDDISDHIGYEINGGGGAGGRVALYFQQNITFSEFRYLASGGLSGGCDSGCEAGGPGTVFIYHLHHKHTTLIIDNNMAPHPRNTYINWDNITEDGCRAWILPLSGEHRFAGNNSEFHFDELQIYGNGHLGVLSPPETFNGSSYIIQPQYSSHVIYSSYAFHVSLFFNFMIGDRTGSVHVHDQQDLNLERREIDLPFNCYVYAGGHLGLAPDTIVHGVEIHLSGALSHIVNLTLHHGGYMWLKHGGHTSDEVPSHYRFRTVRIQDDATVNATTDPVIDPGITFYTEAVYVEGGGVLHGTRMTLTSLNVTVDAAGSIMADGLGYHHIHRQDSHGHLSLHGDVNPGIPPDVGVIGAGAGHGGSGGRVNGRGAGLSYGDLYQPYVFGSAGGPGLGNTPGGTGGGVIWINVTGTFHIDGIVSANGGPAAENGAGGGSGGSIWVFCTEIKGYGKITVNGGAGSNLSSSPGSGGAGGRLAVYFEVNRTMTGFGYHSWGGRAGDRDTAENGGAGTAFIYHMVEEHRTLIVDNGGLKAQDEYNIITNYYDLSDDGCRAWILPMSGTHKFGSNLHIYDYNFEEIQMHGEAHMAILTDPVDAFARLFFLYMIGDRTGTVHLGNNQKMDLHRPEIDLPFSVRAYRGSYTGLAPYTVIHSVSVWMHGELDHIEFLTLHHDGLLSMEHYGHTSDSPSNHYMFDWVKIQDNSTVSGITDPVTEDKIHVYMNNLWVEGGGTMKGTWLEINAVNIVVDDGGSINGDGLGYRTTDPKNVTLGINLGSGISAAGGSSGAGHGGSSGHGAGTDFTGQPYGHVFEPRAYGSSGGGQTYIGGVGGGIIRINVTDKLQIDGVIHSNGNDAAAEAGGGGSGGSVLIRCGILTGTGKVAANGGDQFTGGTGGGGAGGRIAVYLYDNQTFLGKLESHGGFAQYTTDIPAESGGPGTVFLYLEMFNHTTLFIDNDGLMSHYQPEVSDYTDLSTDSFKAWFLPQSGDHYFAKSNHYYFFHEIQIYGNAHLAIQPEPFEEGASLFFVNMIGDRTGSVHIGPYQVMNLKRDFIDVPFNIYIYQFGYVGLAPDTVMQQVFIQIQGTLDHIFNLTLVHGAQLRLFQTGSTNSLDPLTYRINGTTIVKARSSIKTFSPAAHSDQFLVTLNLAVVEGGGLISSNNLYLNSNKLNVDDGGAIEANSGGYLQEQGPGEHP